MAVFEPLILMDLKSLYCFCFLLRFLCLPLSCTCIFVFSMIMVPLKLNTFSIFYKACASKLLFIFPNLIAKFHMFSYNDFVNQYSWVLDNVKMCSDESKREYFETVRHLNTSTIVLTLCHGASTLLFTLRIYSFLIH